MGWGSRDAYCIDDWPFQQCSRHFQSQAHDDGDVTNRLRVSSPTIEAR